MRLLARALTVAALASLVLAGVALAAARDATAATDGGTEMEFLAQYEPLAGPSAGPGMYEGPGAPQVRIARSYENVAATLGPSDVLILPPMEFFLVSAISAQSQAALVRSGGQLPPEWFDMTAFNMGYAQGRNISSEPVDVIVG